MKRIWVPVIIFLILLGGTTQTTAVDMVGSKAYGMGGAFTAVADDVSSLYWNPAGLTRNSVVGGEVSVGVHSASLDDLLEITEGLILGTKDRTEPVEGRVTAFIGANLGSYSGGLIRDEVICFDGSDNYTDSLMVGNIAFARQFRWAGKLSLGVNIKMIQRTYSTYKNTGIEERSFKGQGFALDIGALWPVTTFFDLGATVKNLGPNLVLTDGAQTMTFIPAQKASVGAALKLGGLTLAADFEHDVQTNDDIVRAGLEEQILFGLIAIRSGVETLLNQHSGISLYGGVGLHLAALEVDLALSSKDYFSNDWSGLLSVSLKF